ncbi:MAG: hypothetical protein LBG27_12770 [Spirochaetaceae bacterium]|nr:hypothetical protein [Spirochaetaceae bacterium]
MDETGSFIRIRSVKSGCGGLLAARQARVTAFWFGTGKHKNLDKLVELIGPLKIGNVYTGGNYAYYERFSSEVLAVTKKNTQKIERKHLSLRTWSARLVRKGSPLFQNRTNAQDSCRPDNKCLVLGRICLIQ